MVKRTAALTTALITTMLVYAVMTHVATTSGVIVYCNSKLLRHETPPFDVVSVGGREYLNLGSYMVPLAGATTVGNGIVKMDIHAWTENLGNCTLLTIKYRVALEGRLTAEYSLLIGLTVYITLLTMEQFLRYNNITGGKQ